MTNDQTQISYQDLLAFRSAEFYTKPGRNGHVEVYLIDQSMLIGYIDCTIYGEIVIFDKGGFSLPHKEGSGDIVYNACWALMKQQKFWKQKKG